MWIGLTDVVSDDNFQWISTRVFLNGWSNWRPSSPLTGDNEYDCVVIRAADGQWEDVPCITGSAFYALCEHLAPGAEPVPVNNQITQGSSQDPWMKLEQLANQVGPTSQPSSED